MLDKIIVKIRTLIDDVSKSGFEVFRYNTSDAKFFPLAEDNVTTVTSVLKNGTALTVTTEYTYDSASNQVQVIVALAADDVIEVRYTYYKYSEAEIKNYINNACIWISISSYRDFDFDIDNEDFYTTPSNEETDLISIVASILIKPNYTKYNLPNKSVTYPDRLNKEDKIRQVINHFKSGLGIFGTIDRSV